MIGISQPSNTTALFDTAHRLGVRYLLDEECGAIGRGVVDQFLADFLDDVDLVYLTIDLDVLPPAVAPGVSSPAAYGVSLETIQYVCDRVTSSGKLAVLDVAELNPEPRRRQSHCPNGCSSDPPDSHKARAGSALASARLQQIYGPA